MMHSLDQAGGCSELEFMFILYKACCAFMDGRLGLSDDLLKKDK